MEYDKRRAHLISYYESVKHAQSVQIDDIPLPTLQVWHYFVLLNIYYLLYVYIIICIYCILIVSWLDKS